MELTHVELLNRVGGEMRRGTEIDREEARNVRKRGAAE